MPDVGRLSLIARHVDAHLRDAPWPWTRTCLRRALVLQRILARAGHAVVLVIGVRRSDGELQAHAWIEHGGTPLLEPEPERVPTYAVLSRFPDER